MGVAWRPLGVSRRRQKKEVAGAWPASGEHAPLPSGARREMTGVASQLDRLVGPEQVGRQVRPGTIPFLSFILFLFSIFRHLFCI